MIHILPPKRILPVGEDSQSREENRIARTRLSDYHVQMAVLIVQRKDWDSDEYIVIKNRISDDAGETITAQQLGELIAQAINPSTELGAATQVAVENDEAVRRFKL